MVSAPRQKKGGKEDCEGTEISSFAYVSGGPSGVVQHGRKLSSQPVYSNFDVISSNGLQEEIELGHGLITRREKRNNYSARSLLGH